METLEKSEVKYVAVHNYGNEFYSSAIVPGFPIGHAVMVSEKDAGYLTETFPEWFTVLDKIPDTVKEAFDRNGAGAVVPHVTGDEVIDLENEPTRRKGKKGPRTVLTSNGD